VNPFLVEGNGGKEGLTYCRQRLIDLAAEKDINLSFK
jgi:hypothetical protein